MIYFYLYVVVVVLNSFYVPNVGKWQTHLPPGYFKTSGNVLLFYLLFIYLLITHFMFQIWEKVKYI